MDHLGPAHDLPVADGGYDGVLCTQVLEHVPNPDAVVRGAYRVLRPGGRLYMTVPLAWELHELPFDFYRYTPHGLARMLGEAGFERLDIRPRNDCFRTLAQLLHNAGGMIGRYPDGNDPRRAEAAAMLQAMAVRVAAYEGLDARLVFPLGYSVVATRPGDDAGWQTAVRDRSAAGLGEARSFVTLCFAADLLADPRLLGAYARRFRAGDDATLVIYAPGTDEVAASGALTGLVTGLGLDGPDSPDMIGLPFPGRAPDESVLAGAVDAVLAPRPPWGAFSGLPWAHTGTLDEIHRLAVGAA